MSIPNSFANVNTNPRVEQAASTLGTAGGGTDRSEALPSSALSHPSGTQSFTPSSPSDAVVSLPHARRSSDAPFIIGIASPYAGTAVSAAPSAFNVEVSADPFVGVTDTLNPVMPVTTAQVSADPPSPSPLCRTLKGWGRPHMYNTLYRMIKYSPLNCRPR